MLPQALEAWEWTTRRASSEQAQEARTQVYSVDSTMSTTSMFVTNFTISFALDDGVCGHQRGQGGSFAGKREHRRTVCTGGEEGC